MDVRIYSQSQLSAMVWACLFLLVVQLFEVFYSMKTQRGSIP